MNAGQILEMEPESSTEKALCVVHIPRGISPRDATTRCVGEVFDPQLRWRHAVNGRRSPRN